MYKKISFILLFSVFICLLTFTGLHLLKESKCGKLNDLVELTVCRSPELERLSRKTENAFDEALRENPNYSLLLQENRKQWEEMRRNCRTLNCLRLACSERAQWLEERRFTELFKPPCTLPALPPDCDIYAYSLYSAPEKADFYIDEDAETGIASIRVNRPGKCTVLFLSAYEPTVWNIYTTPETRLAAVVVSGYKKQMLRGMPDGTETINNTCLPGYHEPGQLPKVLQKLSLWNENTTVFAEKINGAEYLEIGEPLKNEAYTCFPENMDGRKLNLSLAPDRAGVRQLRNEGKIRRLISKDIKTLKSYKIEMIGGPFMHTDREDNFEREFSNISRCHGHNARDDKAYDMMCNTYLMLENFPKLPEGLGGANAISLFVPDGLAPPENHGHSTLYRIHMPVEKARHL